MPQVDLSDAYQHAFDALVQRFGEPKWSPTWAKDPVGELIRTILSQATSDHNRDLGYEGLTSAFDSWDAVMAAAVERIAKSIYSAGLANQKAERIQQTLRTIHRQRGKLDLTFLNKLSTTAARDWLTAMKGIGHKSASVLLLFAFNKPTFPVDTHVHRIIRRLGWVSPKVTADKASYVMENKGNPDTFFAMHLNLIRLGREICQARQPKCGICPLREQCDYCHQHSTSSSNE